MATILRWALTPGGRLATAAAIFALIWAIKNLPGVAKWLSTDRRKLVANAVLSLAPAAVMLADQSVPASEAWQAALATLLTAAGIQGVAKALLGDKLKGASGIGVKPAAAPATDQPAGVGERSEVKLEPPAGEP